MIEKNASSRLRPRRRPVRRPPQRLKASLILPAPHMLLLRLDSRRRWEEWIEHRLHEVLAELRQQGVGTGGGDVGLQQLRRLCRLLGGRGGRGFGSRGCRLRLPRELGAAEQFQDKMADM